MGHGIFPGLSNVFNNEERAVGKTGLGCVL
jgi:hypothetical protein